MAKKTSRSQADDTTAVTPEKRGARARSPRELVTPAVANHGPDPVKLNSVADGPETISRELDASSDPTEQDIRDRAYQMYLERGARHGRDFDDWLRAEDELKKRR